MEIITWILDWSSSSYATMFVSFWMLLLAAIYLKEY